MPAHSGALRLLLLGGTEEARLLAEAIARRFGDRVEVVTSLAGRTLAPAALPGRVRVGGFGGADGLARYLAEERIDLVIDATHPFATRIKAQARLACAQQARPLLALQRRPWTRQAGDDWRPAAGMAEAATLLNGLGRRVFLTIGAQAVAAFGALPEHWFLVRLVEPRTLPLARYELVIGRGPFIVAEELALLRRHRIDVLVTKASGGTATVAKLEAARALGLPVIMVARPAAAGEALSIESVLDWIAPYLARAAGTDGLTRPRVGGTLGL